MISVVVPTYNEEKEIAGCLKSLLEQDFPQDRYEIIMIDAYSEDRTVEIAREYIKTIYFHPPLGPAQARNLGTKRARFPVVAFIDADCIAPKDWLKRVQMNFDKDPQLVGLGGVLKPRDPRLIDSIMFLLFSNWFVRISAFFGLVQLYGNISAYKKDAFERIGGFSSDVSFWEDTELTMRLKKAGLGHLKIDGNWFVHTSARRFQQKGYMKVFRQNFTAYLNYIRGRKIDEPYFQEIKH